MGVGDYAAEGAARMATFGPARVVASLKSTAHRAFDKVTNAATTRYAQCSDEKLSTVLFLSCVAFHSGWKHEAYPARFTWKDDDYPRSLRADITAITRLAQNITVLRKGRVVAGLLQPVSDPGGIAFDFLL